jgi:hypothetical protein
MTVRPVTSSKSKEPEFSRIMRSQGKRMLRQKNRTHRLVLQAQILPEAEPADLAVLRESAPCFRFTNDGLARPRSWRLRSDSELFVSNPFCAAAYKDHATA